MAGLVTCLAVAFLEGASLEGAFPVQTAAFLPEEAPSDLRA